MNNVLVLRLIALCVVAISFANRAKCGEWDPSTVSTRELLGREHWSLGFPNDSWSFDVGDKLHNESTNQTWVVKKLVFLLEAKGNKGNRPSSYRYSIEFSDQQETSPDDGFAFLGKIVESDGHIQSGPICKD